MAGKGGGAWKVAYADFVTAMMAFFLVMWITAQSDKVKEAIAHHFNDPYAPVPSEESENASSNRPPKFASPSRLSHDDETEAGGGGRTLLLTNQGGERTAIGTIIHFAETSVELDAAARRRLEEFAPYVLGKPQRLEIRGHSTRRPLPADSAHRDHWHLTYDRCLAVMTALEELGVPRERMRLSQAAGNEPITLINAKLSGGKNARVEISLLNETALPPASEQQAPSRPEESDHGHKAEADHGHKVDGDHGHKIETGHGHKAEADHGHGSQKAEAKQGH